MHNKLSTLEPGQIVTDISGAHYRVASKIVSSTGAIYRFVDMRGRTISSVTPVGSRMAHLASALHFHLAYNKDFDLYIRAYCEQAGLPIPIGPNGLPFEWADWFQRMIFPKLKAPSSDAKQTEEIRDEAIHEMLFNELGTRNILAKFRDTIQRNFSEDTKALPEDKQLTIYLTGRFKWRVEEMNRKINEQYPPEETAMLQGEEEGEEFNLLDTEEHATQPLDEVETERDMRMFRKDFYAWLKKNKSENAAKGFISLFDLYLEPGWMEKTKFNPDELYKYIGNLAALLEQFIKANRKNLTGTKGQIFVKLIDSIHHQREKLREVTQKAQSAHASSDKGMHSKIAAQLVRGDELTPEMVEQVKDSFIYRWTTDNPRRTEAYHCDKCDINNPYVNPESAEGHPHPTVPLKTDDEWIKEHAFYFTQDGRLMPRRAAEPAYLAGQQTDVQKEAATPSSVRPKPSWPLSTPVAPKRKLIPGELQALKVGYSGMFGKYKITRVSWNVWQADDDGTVVAQGTVDDIISALTGGLRVVSAYDGPLECCGSTTGYHKPDCPVYNENFEKTLGLLNSLPKRSADESWQDDLPLLWHSNTDGKIHLSDPDEDPSQGTTYCGAIIGYTGHQARDTAMIPMGRSEVHNTMADDAFCDYCMGRK